jgi:hypothetical protein
LIQKRQRTSINRKVSLGGQNENGIKLCKVPGVNIEFLLVSSVITHFEMRKKVGRELIIGPRHDTEMGFLFFLVETASGEM